MMPDTPLLNIVVPAQAGTQWLSTNDAGFPPEFIPSDAEDGNDGSFGVDLTHFRKQK